MATSTDDIPWCFHGVETMAHGLNAINSLIGVGDRMSKVTNGRAHIGTIEIVYDRRDFDCTSDCLASVGPMSVVGAPCEYMPGEKLGNCQALVQVKSVGGHESLHGFIPDSRWLVRVVGSLKMIKGSTRNHESRSEVM
ncbi:hypothetical protein HAX54_035138, partial [Datura stramonium]|nr:hypothetical protein [Datura stramonium]